MGLAAGGVWWARLGCIARRNPACCMNSGPPWPGWCHRLVRAMPHLGDGHQPCDDPRDSRAGSNVGQWPDAGRQSEPGVAPRTFRDGYPNCVSRLPSSSPEAATASRLAAWTRCHSDHVEVAVRWCAAVAGARQRRQPRRSNRWWQSLCLLAARVSDRTQISSVRRTPELLRPACRWPPDDPPRRCPGPRMSLVRVRAGTHA